MKHPRSVSHSRYRMAHRRARADVNAQDEWGRTPLMFAAHFNFRGGINFLLYHGANINARNKKGHTVPAYTDGHPGLIRLLKERRAKEEDTYDWRVAT